MSDARLKEMTPEFRGRLMAGETLDDLLPEAFAVCREAAKRVIGQRHFDVQLIGGMSLHKGWIAEMKTGEGKTLTATLPLYLNALTGKGCHLVTVNDYLARRDSEWMGSILRFLGISVGLIVHQLEHDFAARQQAYACDVTYGTNNEFGFDYLRDNMAISPEELVMRELNYAHRRRGGLHPHRRGPHPPHHLGPRRGSGGPLPALRRRGPTPERKAQALHGEGAGRDRSRRGTLRLPGRREGQRGQHHGEGHRALRGDHQGPPTSTTRRTCTSCII